MANNTEDVELRDRFYDLCLDQLREFGVDVDSSPYAANRFGVLVWKQLKPLIQQESDRQKAELLDRLKSALPDERLWDDGDADSIASNAARAYNSGLYTAKKIIQVERSQLGAR